MTLSTDWHGEAYVGVVLGNALVGYGAGVRRSLDWDRDCERELLDAPEDWIFEEICGPLYEPVPDPDNPVDPFVAELQFNYSPLVDIRTGTFGINPCTPSRSTVGRLEGIGANAAAAPLDQLPNPAKLSFYTATNPCESGGPPICLNPEICGAECLNYPDFENCPACPCDGCQPGLCDVCDDHWSRCTTLFGDDYPDLFCLQQIATSDFEVAGCNFARLQCDGTLWQWLPTSVDPADGRTELEVDAGGVVGPIGLTAPNQLEASLATGPDPGRHVLSGEVRYFPPPTSCGLPASCS